VRSFVAYLAALVVAASMAGPAVADTGVFDGPGKLDHPKDDLLAQN
jgi:hypothetical protein